MDDIFAHQFAGIVITDDTTKEYRFDEMLTQPTCIFKPATEDNKSYAAALLKLAAKRQKRRGSRQKPTTTATIEKTRNDNRVLVAKYCLMGWKDMLDTNPDGPQEVPFNQKNALAFLNALPHFIFDRLYNWLQEPLNFIPDADDEEDEDEPLTLDELDDLEQTELEDIVSEETETLGKSSGDTSNGN